MNYAVTVTPELIKKYDCALPRYTSYPTAPHFHKGFNSQHYCQQADYSNQALLPRDLSLYIHIPFCHSLCYFCGCHKVVTQPNHSKVDDYVDALLKEIRLRATLIDDDRRVTQIHFGGGTPNFLNTDRLTEIINEIATYFHLDVPSRMEISIEIDPRAIQPEDIDALAKVGFNRFSIGIQDFSKPVQEAVNRTQSEMQTLQTIAAARAVSDSVNVDLITGLPQQTHASFSQTLEKVINSGVTRIAAYNFAYLPERIKAQRLIDSSTLPNAQARLQLTQVTRDILLDAGFVHIGMDHFAARHDSLAKALSQNTLQRNFQGYTTHKNTDLIGLGVSSISHFNGCYAQNVTELSVYQETISRGKIPINRGIILSHDDQLRAALIQQIMCRQQVNLQQKLSQFIETCSNDCLADYFATELSKLASFIDDDLITLNEIGFTITATGRYFMRPIAAIFDRYLKSSPSSSNQNLVKFSRTI